jgi:transcriptional regulator with XRE-family HTH domain
MGRTSSKQKLGTKVRQLRTGMGLTQEKLGEMTDLDRTYISGIERGKRNPSIAAIEQLAKALKVKTSDLIDF